MFLVIGFRQANEVEMTDDQMSQRELIRRILVLKDLHSVNYGIDSKGKLSIVDFRVYFKLHFFLILLF